VEPRRHHIVLEQESLFSAPMSAIRVASRGVEALPSPKSLRQTRSARLGGKEFMDVFLEHQHFEPLVGKVAHFKGTRFAIPLIKVIRSEKFVSTAQRDPFLLIFRAPKEREYMPEGYYECAFEDGPTYNIYLAPAHTPEPEWQDYQAVFN
jgi:hypothetical protein